MEAESAGAAIADLVEAAAIQDEVAQHRLALEWGQMVFARLLQVWTQLETYEAVAYEDKVAMQVRVLDDAAGSLHHLHKTLARTCRRLKAHQKRRVL